MNEIIFNGKGNHTDFDVILNYFKPQPPAPKTIREDVPYMNGAYDFSTIGSNGEIVYSERKIPCSIEYHSSNTALMMIKYSKLLEWLLSGWHELIYTGESDMRYMAKVEQAPSFDAFKAKGGKLQFEFTAEPFKQGVSLIGQELWDSFNFETDYMQDSEFDVNGSKTITLYNPGRAVVPTINCNSSMTVSVNGYAANFIVGDNRNWKFKLKPGTNTLQISGNGHIKFVFRKEVL